MNCLFTLSALRLPGGVTNVPANSVRFRRFLVCLLTITVSAQFAAATLADDNEAASPSLDLPGNKEDVSSRGELLVGEPIEKGYVIIGGHVIPPPYRVALKGHEVYINDMIFAELGNEYDENGRSHPDRTRTNPKRFVATLERQLTLNNSAIAFDDRTRVVVDPYTAARFLRAVGRAETVQERVQMVFTTELESAIVEEYRVPTFQWRSALADFQLTDSQTHFIQEMGTFEGDDVDLSRKRESRQVNSVRVETVDYIYLINVVGMLLVAISIGTLLGHRPATNVRWSKLIDSQEAYGLLVKCLVLVVALSAFDLTCTLIAETAEGFEELNPLAGSLADSPLVLIAFKLVLSSLGVGLLWFRRKYAGAQLASWWLCLILTLVVTRWVVIQSLFYL